MHERERGKKTEMNSGRRRESDGDKSKKLTPSRAVFPFVCLEEEEVIKIQLLLRSQIVFFLLSFLCTDVTD